MHHTIGRNAVARHERLGLRIEGMAIVASGDRVLALRIMRVGISRKLPECIRNANGPRSSLGWRRRLGNPILIWGGRRGLGIGRLPRLLRRGLNRSTIGSHSTIRRRITRWSRLRLRGVYWHISILRERVVRHHGRVSLCRRRISLRHGVLIRLLNRTAVLRVPNRNVMRCPIRLMRVVVWLILRTRVETLRVVSALLACLASFSKVRLVSSRHRARSRDTVRVIIVRCRISWLVRAAKNPLSSLDVSLFTFFSRKLLLRWGRLVFTITADFRSGFGWAGTSLP